MYKDAKDVQPLLLLRDSQRKIIQAELACMAIFITELYYQQDLKMGDETRRRRMRELIQKELGGPEGPGRLQIKMNREMDGILDRFQADFPQLSWQDVLVLSYSAARLSNDLSYHLAGLTCGNNVSSIRSRLRRIISYSHSPYKEEYLSLLPEKGCRIG